MMMIYNYVSANYINSHMKCRNVYNVLTHNYKQKLLSYDINYDDDI